MENLSGKRLPVRIDLFFFLNQFPFLFLGWAGNVRDQIKYSHQQSSKDENAKKQFWLSVHKVEENQCKNDDDDNRLVLGKGKNVVHEP